MRIKNVHAVYTGGGIRGGITDREIEFYKNYMRGEC